MGIIGFGALREEFCVRRTFFEEKKSNNDNDDAVKYIACFDVTPFVIYAMRSNAVAFDRNCFERVFVEKINESNEMRHLRSCRPQILRYTLDNGSPRAKRHTQLRRMTEVPLLTRMLSSSASSDVCGDAQKKEGSLRIVHVATAVRNVLTSDPSFTLGVERTEFDFDEGEGEIKAINWLMSQQRFRKKLIMSRDNDVYVYVLSKLTTSPAIAISTIDLLVFHERSRHVYECWHEFDNVRASCWIFVLWLSICYGNDYAYGIINTNTCAVSRTYAFIKTLFFRTYRNIAEFDPVRFEFVNDANGCWNKKNDSNENETIRALIDAFDVLRCALRESNNFEDDDENQDTAAATDDDGIIRAWIVRHVWSLFYTLEMPRCFKDNRSFQLAKNITINASMSMPYITKRMFFSISRKDLSMHVESVLRQGVVTKD